MNRPQTTSLGEGVGAGPSVQIPRRRWELRGPVPGDPRGRLQAGEGLCESYCSSCVCGGFLVGRGSRMN